MTAEHTPGPWKIHWNMGRYAEHHNIVQAEAEDYGRIAFVEALPPTSGDMEALGRANAELIAAAPETAADRDRLAKEVERLREVNAGYHKLLSRTAAFFSDDPDVYKDEWLEMANLIAEIRAALAKEQ